MEELSALYTAVMYSSMGFISAKKIVLDNSSGKVWLIGGSVYRNIAHILYGADKPKVDFDFIIESPKENIILPKGWKLGKNHYGNPKFLGRRFSIDFVPLHNISSILRRKLAPSIKNYLTGTPLTVQSIAYDVKGGKLAGEIGLKAIAEKTIGINNKEQAQIYALKKGISIEEMVRRKSESLGFTPLIRQ
ncbi:MAG TPA: hypothetical protein HA362_00850 [Nanoarchaeota archaeon]|nr:hypothetical protein [Nanoarchaeota archaeon]